MSTCPSCGDDANTQKVSGLYRAQSGRRGISELAELLEPPMKPPQVGEYLGFAGGSILLVLMLAFGLLGLIVFFIPGMLLGMLAGGLLGERLGTVYENITEPDKSAKAKIENERRASKYRLRLEHWGTRTTAASMTL